MKPLWKAIVIVTSAILLVTTALLNIAIWTGLDFGGWFRSDIIAIYQKYELEVFPATWSYQIWIFIFLYQFAWMSYVLSTFCRRTNNSFGSLYYSPDFLSGWLFVFYTLNLLLDIGWMFTFDREQFQFASPFLTGVSLTLYACLGFSLHALDKHGLELLRLGHRLEVQLVRGLIQNGLAAYGTWVTVTSAVNIGILAVSVYSMSVEDASTVCLAIIGTSMVIFSILDTTLLDRYSRYVVMPYLVLIYTSSSMVHKSQEVGGRNLYIAGIILGMSLTFVCVKSFVLISRRRTDPEPLLRQR